MQVNIYPAQPGSWPPNAWQYGLTVVPTTPTLILGQTTRLTRLFVANTTGSPVTITVTDNSTEAGGSPCQVFPGVTIAANGWDSVDFGGVTANNGVKWFASSANALHAELRGAY